MFYPRWYSGTEEENYGKTEKIQIKYGLHSIQNYQYWLINCHKYTIERKILR